MNPAPFFSIVIPTHNRPHLLPRSVNSTLVQDYDHFEIIVVDEGSRVPASQSLADVRDSRLRLFRNDTARGVSVARNSAIAAAKGDWIVFLDDDDELLPGYLQAIAKAIIAAPPKTGLAWTSIIFSEAGPDGTANTWLRTIPGFADGAAGPYPMRPDLSDIHFGIGAISVRRDALLGSGGFDEAMSFAEDYDLILRLVGAGWLAVAVNSPLARFNLQHELRLTNAAAGRRRILAHMRVLRKNRKFLRSRKGAEDYLLWVVTRDLLRGGFERRGWRVLAYLLKTRPTHGRILHLYFNTQIYRLRHWLSRR
ncbi:MAG TPA: glycosyltransferase family 2 protein [Arsenicitalea sp.]|nr:glycosyltransferase family 2 protein [Arsenicitalea sp.]